MKLGFTPEQRELSGELDRMLASADLPEALRARASGDSQPARDVWGALAEMGLMGLLVPEEVGGAGADLLDVVAVAVQLGRHAVPGPWIEHAVYLPCLLAAQDPMPGGLTWEGLASGDQIATVRVGECGPRALDADLADVVLVVDEGFVRGASVGPERRSIDRTRKLFDVRPEAAGTLVDTEAAARALDVAALAQSAQLLGLAERMLELTVSYITTRKQFGHVVGEYQAVAHHAANARIAIDFARPLLWGAVAALSSGSADAGRAVSAAKVRTAEAARRSADTGLQLHGAIGYTAEYDLSLYWLRAQALTPAWGTVDRHRRRILESLESREVPLWSLS